jgi:hypothetical protein
MSEVVDADTRKDLEDTLLAVAMLIDTAQQATAEDRESKEFFAAAAAVRECRRRQIELTDDLAVARQYLKQLDAKLAPIGGCATGAVFEARQTIGELLRRVRS